jgi:3-oxo-5-alpha-steroid 4-dehydrogenase 1
VSELVLHGWLVRAWFLLALVTFVVLFGIVAPYGRHVRAGWGPIVPARVGWLIMEVPAVAIPLVTALSGPGSSLSWLLLSLWLGHYIHRTFVYPFRMRMSGRSMPLVIAMMGASTNLVINWLIFRWHFGLAPVAPLSGLEQLRVGIGVVLFVAGLALNLHSDGVLRRLRAPGEGGYHIPQQGAHRWVSCPNYLGEIVEWAGFAICAASPAALAFLVWTLANLLPRARDHHRWYRATFPDYPSDRRILLPGIW